jgi:hypothetical protein
MGVTRGNLKAIVKNLGRYHEIRWNVDFSHDGRTRRSKKAIVWRDIPHTSLPDGGISVNELRRPFYDPAVEPQL